MERTARYAPIRVPHNKPSFQEQADSSTKRGTHPLARSQSHQDISVLAGFCCIREAASNARPTGFEHWLVP